MLTSQDRLFILIVSLLTITLVYLLSPILSPFLVAALLAYLANPLVNKLMRLKLSRILSVTIVFLLLFSFIILAFVLLVPFIETQISLLIQKIPDMIAWTQTIFIPWVSSKIYFKAESADIHSLQTLITNNWAKASNLTVYLLTSFLHSGSKAMGWLMNLLLIPVVTFYLMCDWPMILTNLRNLLPRRTEPTVVALMTECDEVLSAFLRGQLLVIMALAAIYSTGLTIIGLQMGLLIGLIAGLLSIVPYLGFIVGIITASIAAYMQFGSISSIALVLVVFFIGQSIDNIILTPRLVGNRIGLHPVAVIFSILAGGSLFGFVGVLLALPVAALIMVWVRYIHKRYHNSKLYKA